MNDIFKEALLKLRTAANALSSHSNNLIRQAASDLIEIHDEIAEHIGVGKAPLASMVDKKPSPQPTTKKTTGCVKCGAEIYFAPHPSNPDKLAPFNVMDDQIHFPTCLADNKREYHSKEELRQAMSVKAAKMRSPSCINNLCVHLATTSDGREFLRVSCSCHGGNVDIIPITEVNKKLIDKPKDWHKQIWKKLYPYT